MKVELELPAEVAWIMKIYATILDKTIEEHCIDTLRGLAEQLGDGHVLGGDRYQMEGPDKAGFACSLLNFERSYSAVWQHLIIFLFHPCK